MFVQCFDPNDPIQSAYSARHEPRPPARCRRPGFRLQRSVCPHRRWRRRWRSRRRRWRRIRRWGRNGRWRNCGGRRRRCRRRRRHCHLVQRSSDHLQRRGPGRTGVQHRLTGEPLHGDPPGVDRLRLSDPRRPERHGCGRSRAGPVHRRRLHAAGVPGLPLPRRRVLRAHPRRWAVRRAVPRQPLRAQLTCAQRLWRAAALLHL